MCCLHADITALPSTRSWIMLEACPPQFPAEEITIQSPARACSASPRPCWGSMGSLRLRLGRRRRCTICVLLLAQTHEDRDKGDVYLK